VCTDPLVSPQRNIGQYEAPYCLWEVQLFPPRVDHINIARENAYDSVTTEATAEVDVSNRLSFNGMIASFHV